MDPSDAELISGYFLGDEKALEALFRRYFRQIYAFIYKYAGGAKDAEDITQKTFLKAWRNLKIFDKTKSFKTWLFTIAKNSAIDFSRKKKDVLLSEAKTLVDPALSPAELSERREIFRGLALSVGKLPQKYSDIISLRYDDGLSFANAARFLGEKLNTVKSRHRRALLMLKSAFLHQK